MDETSNEQSTTWILDDRKAIAQDGSRRSVYVRALIDIASYEFASSQLSYLERLQIIESVGIDLIFSVMAEISLEKGRRYSKEVEGKFDLDCLRRMATPKIVSGV